MSKIDTFYGLCVILLTGIFIYSVFTSMFSFFINLGLFGVIVLFIILWMIDKWREKGEVRYLVK